MARPKTPKGRVYFYSWELCGAIAGSVQATTYKKAAEMVFASPENAGKTDCWVSCNLATWYCVWMRDGVLHG